MKNEVNAIITLGYRDLIRYLRDRTRIIATFIFPLIFVGVLGNSLESNWGNDIGYSFILFTFIGVIAQTLFQSTAGGIISLIEDRENNYSQEIFISPISRYTIILGKIFGESLVALAQIVGIIIFGIVMRVPFSFFELLRLFPAFLVITMFGGAFGVFVLGNLGSQRSANQIFPFIMFPQFFLAGVFNPINQLPWYLLILSRISPMTYAVDFLRSLYYLGRPEYSKVVLFNPLVNFSVMAIFFFIFLTVGTYIFVRNERNK